MMKKRLSKTLWYGSDIDKEGKPVLPPLADEANDLEGIHEGELYLHLGDGSALLFTRSADGQVVQLGSNADELANYLLKSVWDKAFEFRTTENGEEYLFTKLNLATQYGITMYANGGLLDLPSIFEGIPFDNKTIWLNPETKLVEVIGSTEEDEGGSADFNNVKESGEGNSFTSFILSEDGKELTFVKGETFAKQSDFAALNTKVADFLEGSDTDNIINKWKELEAFLSGMKESDDLATILATKWTKDDAKIANWDAAFGWGDHSKVGYAKAADVTEELKKYVTLSGTQTITGEKDFTGGLKVNGQPIVYDARGFWKLDGDLIITGGITMYANEGQYTPSTITDAVNIDNNTLIRVNGVIMLNPDIEIGGGTDIDLSEYAKKATTLSGYGITDAYTKNAVDGLLEDKADTATTLAGYGITNAYTKTQVDNLLGDFVTSDDVETLLDDYLPLTGGTITGDLRLRKGTEYTSPYLYFGDSDEVWLKESTDTQLTIHADGSVKIDSPKTIIDGIEIKKSASGVLFIDANLVVSGGITMYGTDGTTANTIWDDAPIASTTVKGIASFDSEFFAVNNGKVTFIGSTGGGGIDSITKQMVIDALGFTPYDEDNPDGFITGITKSMVTTALGYTPYNSTNPSGYITGITKSMVTTALGFTPYNATNPNGYITSSGSITGNAATATTASKLSTTNKTAWGQTYWTSGGVPNSIDGDMSNVGHIKLKRHNSYDIGTDSVGVRYIYANWIGGVSGGNFSIGANDSTVITILTDKSVGIGTTSPKSKLHVAGSAQADNTFWLTNKDTGNATLGYAQGGTMILRHNSSGQTILSGSGGTLYFRPNGTSSDSGQCTISSGGNLLVTGGITMYSDLRKKTILNYVELSLKEVADAPLIEHYYNSDEKKTTHVGSVAQYWAGLNDWFCKEDEEGFLTMEIQNAALASAISVARELTRYESKTDKQIKKLKKRIGELEEEIENLKKM